MCTQSQKSPSQPSLPDPIPSEVGPTEVDVKGVEWRDSRLGLLEELELEDPVTAWAGAYQPSRNEPRPVVGCFGVSWEQPASKPRCA